MEKLSKMQKRVYEYIVQSIQDNGYAPSVREIGEALGLKSPSTVHFHVKHLEELGRRSAAIRCRSLGMSRRAAQSLPRNAWRII